MTIHYLEIRFYFLFISDQAEKLTQGTKKQYELPTVKS
jgi:hypothetical protein